MPRCPRLALLLVPVALAFAAGLARADDPPAPPKKEKPRSSDKPWIGPADESIYPPRERSPYLLPWPGAVTYRCIQGNRGIVSHRGPGRYAYDFGMPVGSTVCAARAGVVRVVIDRHQGRGTNAPNNKIGVRHADGTTGWYLHLKKGGALVHVGDRVRQGQPIGLSGNVGRSLMPHLHFHVAKRGGGTIPITFHDVKADKGIPRILRMYTSGNRKAPPPPPTPAE